PAFALGLAWALALAGCRGDASKAPGSTPTPKAPAQQAPAFGSAPPGAAAPQARDAGAPAVVRPEPARGSMAQLPDGAWVMRGHREVVFAVAVSADGKRAATGSQDRTVRIWDLESHSELALIKNADEA